VKQGLLPYRIELHNDDEHLTAWAGLPLLLEALRAVVTKRLFRNLRTALGYRGWKTVRRHLESLVLLIGSGASCIDDLAMLRADRGLSRLLGYELSSPTQAKVFLYRFHQSQEGLRLSAEQDAQLSVAGKAQVRPEGPGLQALERVVAQVVAQLQTHRRHYRATLDVDATIIEAHKASALRAYEGTVGYQPQLCWWAEHGVWLVDEFRDGNVNAEFEARRFLERVKQSVPPSVRQLRLRADSAFYNEAALSWADDQGIAFAVSADMSKGLAGRIRAISGTHWRPYRSLNTDQEEREWAEVVDFVPDWKRNHRKHGLPFRYIAIRVRSRQRDLLFDDSQRWRHFAVVINMDWDGERLLRWQREKQGTIEQGHRVLKNELAASPLPCGRFGANAAWLRLNILMHNLLELLKVEALPSELASCRPKALRFRLFHLVGRLIYTGRQLILRLAASHPFAAAYRQARAQLRSVAQQTST
jgi:hypothetical protein